MVELVGCSELRESNGVGGYILVGLIIGVAVVVAGRNVYLFLALSDLREGDER
jgi:hypothetical protein